ncbi:phytoene desaturase family protein [Aeromicrobium stalagmiti]|uniref:phytoene desaturase family protein n=1 Tax=Aeromicrobium stalagmiti TaxID=2738988 RepID=UPI0015691562|nr:FAD-dependent oxidoreductase [Aeromicrobium stalagmiti]NRQ51008.1 NAD(P)/FAD-dependent oxidoreductase [Aeromicrobium stalagmiti]
MANVVVVGGGFAGLTAAARLAKLRHDVTLLEAGDRLGGRLHGHTVNGQAWQIELDTVSLPGVFRDLFRKSGRPLERVLDFTKTEGRRHVFKDGSVLDLPLGNRGDQHEAVSALLGEDEWSPWVDRFAEPWDVIRRMALDQVFPGKPAVDRSVRRMLKPRRTIQALDRDFADERLAKIVLDPVRLAGQDWRATPAFAAVTHYVERSFGRWRFDGGLPALADALEKRLAERKVTVQLGESAHELVRDGGRVTGVVTDRRTVPADVVVWAAPTWPAPLPPPRALPVIPASRTLVTLSPEAPALADEVLVHANPPIRLWSNGGGRWTLEHRSGEDPLHALVRFGIDLRPFVVDRIDLTPSDLVVLGHWGWVWNTWTTAFDLPGVAPSGGLYFAGAHAHPGGTLEAIGMATAAIAADVGPAPR